MVGTVLVLSVLLLRRPGFMRRRPRLAAAVRLSVAGLVAVAMVYLIDQKIVRLQDELLKLRLRLSSGTSLAATHANSAARQTPLLDLGAVQRALEAQFGQVQLESMICDDATDFIQIRLNDPYVQARLAVVDLRNPKLKVKIGADFDHKTLTSAFARENDCTVAINGEAGATPAPDSGLGSWRGHMMQEGKVLLVEESSIRRPFLAFNRDNGATFISAGAADRAVPAEARNVIWGRWDLINQGRLSPTAMRDRQPRTAMAIDRQAKRLYLLVVDGRQPRYSMGMTRAEAGQTLLAFGAWSGMLCDEGGSSCIYVRPLGGIANVPSDHHGQERPTYTHFGVSLE
jgi:hypothetical protein